jgi:tRNA(Ile)-lysidine synthase
MRLLDEIDGTGPAAWQWGNGELRRYRGVLRYRPATPVEPATSDTPCPESGLSVRRAGRHALPGWRGILQVTRVKEGGVPLAWLAHVDLKAREGGERFQAGIGRPPRSLKKQFQAAAVASWEREGPLVYSGGQLVFVPGLGIDARMIGLPGQTQVKLDWLPTDAPARDASRHTTSGAANRAARGAA